MTKVGDTLVVAAVCALCVCCNQAKPSDAQRRVAASAASPSLSGALPVDHLLPGELRASANLVFGFPVPSEMRVERTFPDAVHLVGEVSLPGLTNYLRQHGVMAAPEFNGSVLIYDRVHLPGQSDSKSFRFQLAQLGTRVRLVITALNPPPVQPRLSAEDSWRMAGRRPDGAPLSNADLR
jgi:hypothetical protein